jgi:hypothetical protein
MHIMSRIHHALSWQEPRKQVHAVVALPTHESHEQTGIKSCSSLQSKSPRPPCQEFAMECSLREERKERCGKDRSWSVETWGLKEEQRAVWSKRICRRLMLQTVCDGININNDYQGMKNKRVLLWCVQSMWDIHLSRFNNKKIGRYLFRVPLSSR